MNLKRELPKMLFALEGVEDGAVRDKLPLVYRVVISRIDILVGRRNL